MADINGIIYGTTSNSKIDVGIVWEETVDIAGNTGSVTATLHFRTRTGYKTSSSNSDFSLTVNGTTATYNNHYFEIGPSDSWEEVAFFNVTNVPHNSDGRKTIVISATGSMSGTSMTSISCSDTVDLYDIPRASAILAPLTTTNIQVDGTNTVDVSLDRKVSTYTHTVRIYVGDDYASATYKTELTGVGASTSFVIPTTWRLTMPTSTTTTAKIDALTFDGTTQIGDTVTGTFIISVPSTVVPSVSASNVTIAPVQLAATTGFSNYVQGYSRAGATFSATGWDDYECAISSYYIQIGSVKTTASPYQTALIGTTGTVSITVGVTDARGRTGTYSENITVYEYSAPSATISPQDVFRCDASGVADEDGAYISSTQSALYATCGGENSIVYLRGRYKATTASTYGSWTTLSDGSATIVGGALSNAVSYDYQVYVEDELGNNSTYSFVIPTASVPFNIKTSNLGVAFGKVSETDELLDSAWKIRGRGGATFDAAIEAATAAVGRESVLNLGGMPLALLATSTDFDTVTETGIYGVKYNPSSYNGPTSNWGVLFSAYTDFAGTAFQVYQPNSFPVSYYRKYTSGAWTAWTKMGVLDAHPVGCIYMSVVSTSPATLFGGTWVQLTDVMLMAAGSTYTAGSTGGAATHEHLAPIAYSATKQGYAEVNGSTTTSVGNYKTSDFDAEGTSATSITVPYTSSESNLPPYLSVYMWKRTA